MKKKVKRKMRVLCEKKISLKCITTRKFSDVISIMQVATPEEKKQNGGSCSLILFVVKMAQTNKLRGGG